MLLSEKHTVWVLTPAGSIKDTTESQAVELLKYGPGYVNHIFFFADLSAPIDEEI
jgi:hypothetical protein